MPDRNMSPKFLHLRRIGAKIFTDMAKRPMGVKHAAVEGDDARRLLTAMLKRMKAKRGKYIGLIGAIDAEDPTFLVEPVELHWSARDL